MRSLRTKLALEVERPYHGPELSAHFLRCEFGLNGDAAAIFRGRASVLAADLVDWEDRQQGAFIASDEMLHLLVECFDFPLIGMILLQRLSAAIVLDLVRPAALQKGLSAERRGDDVFVGEGKLSVSIATSSTVSTLMHMGVNVKATGAPVRVAALCDLGLDKESFARAWLLALQAEYEGLYSARAKVRGVSEWNP